MRRMLMFLGLVLIAFSTTACSTPKTPTVPAVQGSKVIATLKDLSSYYGKKNLSGFASLVSDDFKDRQSFTTSIQSVFSSYDAVQFTVQYTKMVIAIDDKGVPRATFNWESGWERAGGSILKNSGRATFVFEPKGAKLAAIEGKNPFTPQAIETPGKQ